MWHELTYTDRAHCVARAREHCMTIYSLPDSGTDVAWIEACAAALSGGECEPGFTAVEACQIPRGKRAAGELCASREQCASRVCGENGTPVLWAWSEEACGTCQPARGLGDACDIERTCSAGLGLACIEGTCQKLRPHNDPCSIWLECQGGACVGGRCKPSAGVGEPCTKELEESPHCELGLVCVQGTCRRPAIAGVGEACTGGPGNPVGERPCGPDLDCVAPRRAQPVCVRRPAAGQPCRAAGGAQCVGAARCIRGTCRLPSPTCD